MTGPGPEAHLDLMACARHLLQRPLLCREKDPEWFQLIRRHEADLDRWFTQRLGYRLHVSADTARLYKSTVVPTRRPLRAASARGRLARPLTQRECTLLCLVLAAVAAGPRVISLRDLVDRVRSAAADARVPLRDEPAERRALVNALHWMVEGGLAVEMHERVELYAADEQADAVLEVLPDRVALVPLRSLGSAGSPEELLERPERVTANRQWMRARLVEDGVIYQDDLEPAEWGELRRRLGEESQMLGEMFGLHLEARAEGVAAIDPEGELSDRPLPAPGTTGHAALLLLERLCTGAAADDRPPPGVVSRQEVADILAELAAENRHWAKEVDEPHRFATTVLGLLADHRLVEFVDDADDDGRGDVGHGVLVQVRPLAHRFAVSLVPAAGDQGSDDPGHEPTAQGSLW